MSRDVFVIVLYTSVIVGLAHWRSRRKDLALISQLIVIKEQQTIFCEYTLIWITSHILSNDKESLILTDVKHWGSTRHSTLYIVYSALTEKMQRYSNGKYIKTFI